MEQQLRERLVGAIVLIVAGIIVIPLLLDGPQNGDPVRVGLELPAADAQRETHTIQLDVPARTPGGPAAPTDRPLVPAPVVTDSPPQEPPEEIAQPEPEPVPAVAAVEEKPEPVADQPEPEAPAPAARAAPEPTSDASAPAARRGGWAVQIGSFSQIDNVERIRGQLRAAGFDVFATPIERGGRTLHRVRVGPVDDRASAEALARRLKAAGFEGPVVRNED